jgi:hypothetical protein
VGNVSTICVVLKLGHFGKEIRNTGKVLKCCAGEGWRSVGPICEKWSTTKSQRGEEYPTNSKRRKANWIGTSCVGNCLLKYVIEGKIEGRLEVRRRRGRRRKQLLDDLKEKRGYWKLKEEALDRTVWRTRFGTCQWANRKTDYRMNEWMNERMCERNRGKNMECCLVQL